MLYFIHHHHHHHHRRYCINLYAILYPPPPPSSSSILYCPICLLYLIPYAAMLYTSAFTPRGVLAQDLVEAVVICDRITGRSKGFGFVRLSPRDYRSCCIAVLLCCCVIALAVNWSHHGALRGLRIREIIFVIILFLPLLWPLPILLLLLLMLLVNADSWDFHSFYITKRLALSLYCYIVVFLLLLLLTDRITGRSKGSICWNE